MNPCESLRQFWISEFHKRGEEVLPFQCESTIMSKLWLNKYEKLEPIEKMPEKDKLELKRYATTLFPGKPAEFRLMACKIIYTIGTLL